MEIVITSGLILLVSIVVITTVCMIRIRLCLEDYKARKDTIRKGFFVLYLFIVIAFTLLPVRIPGEIPYGFEYNINILELLKAFSNRAALISYSENIIMFMPVTILGYLGNVKATRTFKGSIFISFVGSISIELLQGLEAILMIAEDGSPVVDVNDVICNVLGGVLGCFLARYYSDRHSA